MSMDDVIREGAGRGKIVQGGDQPRRDPRPADPSTTEAQLTVARACGIPDHEAHRIRGDTAEELRADAQEFAATVAATGGWADPPPPPTDFDQGARATTPTEPSVNDQIRGALHASRLTGGSILNG
jgi:hypothetical protein